MDKDEILKKFAGRFVEKNSHDRMLHEAKKKPQDLHTRICHGIEKVFSSKYAGSSITYQLEDKCLILSGNNIEETTWALAEKQMGLGNGLLIIDSTGGKFYEETESGARSLSKIYGGQS
jgi:hypothetical protein